MPLFLLPILARLKSVPRWVWLLAALVGILALGSCWHGRRVKAHDNTIIAARDAYWKDKLDKAHLDALSWKQQAEETHAAIAADLRNRNDETLRHNAAVADSLRLRGPGKASCRQGDNSSVAVSPGGRDEAAGNADAARSGVPEQDGAGVSWGWLVDRSEQCDANRSEAETWRRWHDDMSKAWPN